MLVLPIKKKWYDMILAEKKKEEYREIKDYYAIRFMNVLGETYYKDPDKKWRRSMIDDFIGECRVNWFKDEPFKVMFRNGYSKRSPFIIAECILTIGTGNPEWGAEADKEYFILNIQSLETAEPENMSE